MRSSIATALAMLATAACEHDRGVRAAAPERPAPIALPAPPAPPPALAAAEWITISNGVVFARASATLYVMGLSGVEAIDVATGGLAWTSSRAARPLAAAGGRVLAQINDRTAGPLRLIALDARTGTVAAELAPIGLPEWVIPTIEQRRGYVFTATGIAHDGKLYVRWFAQSGIAPSLRDASGTQEIDLASGRIGAVVTLPAGPPTGTFRHDGFEQGPFHAGGVEARIVGHRKDGPSGGERTVRIELHRRSGGTALPVLVLAEGPESRIEEWPSYDRTEVMVRDGLRWSILSLETGARIGGNVDCTGTAGGLQIASDREPAPCPAPRPAISWLRWNDRIIGVDPERVRAQTVAGGALLWERALLDVRGYLRGP